MPTKLILIKGEVQGVFYRATAKQIAVELGITGWIKNTPNGHVEAKISGTEEKLLQFINWCGTGPAKARVTEVSGTNVPGEYFESFRIIR